MEFTEHCETAIVDGSLSDLLVEVETQLEGYTSVDISGEGTEAKVLELKLKALILDAIHNIDVVRLLIAEGVKKKDNWLWQKQLRFYVTDKEGRKAVCTVTEYVRVQSKYLCRVDNQNSI